MVIGIDEVGRGAWAGPLVVGAVALQQPVPALQDSKLLSKIKRAELAKEIYQAAEFAGLGWVSASEVDDMGLTEATRLACTRALMGAPQAAKIQIDGAVNFLADNPNCTTVINGDALIPAISAASIIAKVARDEFMAEQAKYYPNYSFELHVGYGTSKHVESIAAYGLTPIHRLSFKPIRKFLEL
jgi:ribonuclease HII